MYLVRYTGIYTPACVFVLWQLPSARYKGSRITEPPVQRALSKASWGADATGRGIACLRMLRVVVSSALDYGY